MDAVLATITAVFRLFADAYLGALRGAVECLLEPAAMLVLSHPVFVVGLVLGGVWEARARRRRARAAEVLVALGHGMETRPDADRRR